MLLRTNHLCKEYKRGNTSFFAVNNIQLELENGDYSIITGRSGSGKSTLLNLIGGLLTPSSGEVYFEDQDIAQLNDSQLSQLRNSKIGFIPQGQSILSNLTILDNVRVSHYLWEREGDAAQKALLLLKQVGIEHLANAYPQQLSGGELRRVLIARALMNNPSLLLADEPTSDLDNQTTNEIMGLFSTIAKNGTAILLITHDMSIVDYGKTVYVMENGELRKAI